MKVKRKETGSVSATNCYNGTNDNAGCGVTGDSATYGEAFNKKGGGIMAMELRPAGIRIWQFLRSDIPSDITANTPDPSSWGEALADFPNTDCDIESHFKNLTIIANIEICGDWAGATDVYTYVFSSLVSLVDEWKANLYGLIVLKIAVLELALSTLPRMLRLSRQHTLSSAISPFINHPV